MTQCLSTPFPLGATLKPGGCNFAIHCPDCEDIALALFANDDEFITYPLINDYAGTKHIFIADIDAGQKYGYIITTRQGPLLLSDPYAKALDGQLHYTPPYTIEQSFSMPKCVVIDDRFDWQESQHPRIPRDEMVLFETHVKGLTAQHPHVEPANQGCYLGLVSAPMLEFYKQQRITTLQLQPVAACMHEPHLLEMKKANYWGYNPYLFMVPDPRYASKDAVIEFKTAIRELHKHGIEVILDVVYNHTAEGGDGPTTFNLKALDNRCYLQYNGHFANFTGCGNSVDLTYQPALNLVMDSLRYWVSEFKVDGFRFDLATTLGREGDNFNPNTGFFKAVAQDPILRETKLIAEPWDIGPNGYQVGQFPFGWHECNDKLRDIARSFWRGDQGYLKEFATRLMGSRDLYSAAHWPYNLTVNYITYHDGFTLQDLVSYKNKHNELNGEQNRDGHGDNRSDNYGVEGDTANASIIEVRDKQKRNLLASLVFAFGIPHVLTADVLSHSQQGNNNAYCQDNELSWLNWQMTPHKTEFRRWLSELLEARERYMVPFIRAFSGKHRNNNRVIWRRVDGSIMEHEDWYRLSAIALHLGINKEGNEMIYLINQTQAPARFTLPNDNQQVWRTICDTNSLEKPLGHAAGEFMLSARSMAILHYQAS